MDTSLLCSSSVLWMKISATLHNELGNIIWTNDAQLIWIPSAHMDVPFIISNIRWLCSWEGMMIFIMIIISASNFILKMYINTMIAFQLFFFKTTIHCAVISSPCTISRINLPPIAIGTVICEMGYLYNREQLSLLENCHLKTLRRRCQGLNCS